MANTRMMLEIKITGRNVPLFNREILKYGVICTAGDKVNFDEAEDIDVLRDFIAEILLPC